VNLQSKTKKITRSAIIMALYIVLMYLTQWFAFGPVQIRVATSLYAIAYFDPFLIIPLGLSNLLSNTFFGGLGPVDILGGGIVGIITSSLTYLVGKFRLNKWFAAIPIILVPGLGVSVWLSILLKIPYAIMATNLLLGQIIPGIIGVLLIKFLSKKEVL